jgi:ribosomal protein S18 acetylase RimI-like enzyme
MINVDLQIRQANEADRPRIANLIHYETYVHRHLDWRVPLDWLGSSHYWVAEKRQRVVAAFACPPDPQNIAWVRLFASSGEFSFQENWNLLWHHAVEAITLLSPITVAAIAMQGWMESLLHESGFVRHQQIVMLEFNGTSSRAARPIPGMVIRQMGREDLPAVARLDAAAFDPLWQNSLDALEIAFSMSGWATVAETSTGIVGYQVSTTNSFGTHLARLAVDPTMQKGGIGRALVNDLIEAMARRNIHRVTVNTQGDNRASLALYQKLGFQYTWEEYPVYVFKT